MVKEDADTLLAYLREKNSNHVNTKALAAELKEKFGWTENDTYHLLSMLHGRRALHEPVFETVPSNVPGRSQSTPKIASFSGLSAIGRSGA